MALTERIALPASKYKPDSVCPTCGGPLTPGTYYVGEKGATQFSSSDIGMGHVSETYSTAYHNLRERTGGICLRCLNQRYGRERSTKLIIGAVGAALSLGCLVLLILTFAGFGASIGNPLRVLILIGAAAGLFLAWKNIPKALTAHRKIKSLSGPIRSIVTQQVISSHLVTNLEAQRDTECAGKEVLLTAYMVDRMRRGR